MRPTSGNLIFFSLFKKPLIAGKSKSSCSSYHPPPTFCSPHWVTVENWRQLNLRWHFPQKPVQLPLLLPWLWCSPSSARFTWWQCHHCQHLLCHHNVAPGAVVADAMLDNVALGTLWAQCHLDNVAPPLPSRAPKHLNWLQPKPGSMSRDATSTSSPPAFFQLWLGNLFLSLRFWALSQRVLIRKVVLWP